MARKNESETTAASEFNLKHRITGAAVLLFFGALVIPWLLGPPSEASRQTEEPTTQQVASQDSDLEDELLDDLQGPGDDVEEQVYISKITPLDAQRNQQLADAAEEAAKSVVAATESAERSAETSEDKESSTNEESSTAGNESSTTADNESSQQNDTPAVAEESEPETAPTEPAQVASAADLAQQQREDDLQAALAAESAGRAPKIEVGWIVQVGLYLEKKGAQTKMGDLSRLGFDPSSTVVDTNRGPKTGTRVWLGPFEKRSQAESENNSLKKKTGKDGFIRVYP